jgi:hypothetical protein
MPSMTERTCANKRCRVKFMARTVDVKRGWGRFCSKSCKASEQEKRTGQYSYLLHHTIPHTLGNYDGDGESEETFCDAHLFSNEEYDCNSGPNDPLNF